MIENTVVLCKMLSCQLNKIESNNPKKWSLTPLKSSRCGISLIKWLISKWNASTLQKFNDVSGWNQEARTDKKHENNLLCCPVFIPQILGIVCPVATWMKT